MRKSLLSAAAVCLLSATAFAQNATVVTTPTGKPNYITIDTLVINLNAVAGISYNAGTDGGTVTITYLNGYTGTYSVKTRAADWTKIQADVVSAGNK